MDSKYYVASLTVTQFRNFRKSVRVLMRTGIDYHTACDIISDAMQARETNRYNNNPRSVAAVR